MFKIVAKADENGKVSRENMYVYYNGEEVQYVSEVSIEMSAEFGIRADIVVTNVELDIESPDNCTTRGKK